MISKNIIRVDALDKVTGRAKYTEDLVPPHALVAKVLHSTFANGIVKYIDTREAEQMDGVEKVVTCFDVPDIQYATSGHPWSLDPEYRDVADRKILNQRVRHYGDCIAAVVARNETIADQAINLLRPEYEEYPVLLDPIEAMDPASCLIHAEFPNNILKRTSYSEGDWQAIDPSEVCVKYAATYSTKPVKHCHIENACSFAYMEGNRVVVVTSTQIPHIVRRIIAQALGIPFGRVRVVKPYVGGGFGNKQDVIYEPLNAFLTMQVGGRCVRLDMNREENFHSTRTRHAIEFQLETEVAKNGEILTRRSKAISNQGGYASHGHVIAANATSGYRNLYRQNALSQEAITVYTNICSGGAMRGYGIPQINFAMESHMDDLALLLNMDPIEFRRINMMREGDIDAPTGIICHSNGLDECLETGCNYINWAQKRKLYSNQSGNIRKGIGMAIFSYKTGAYPSAMEIASARVILTQDGSVQIEMGATEIGQGADTVFAQIAAEALSIKPDSVHVITTQDTDHAPFDTGAYASRQTYVSGTALKQTCMQLKQKIICYAAELLEQPQQILDISDSAIINTENRAVLISLEELAMTSFYSRKHATHITAESSFQCKNNTYALGCCFAEIEVNIPMGRIKILDIINVHDSGRIINPALATAQVHGGIAMGIGYALSEQMLYDEKGKLLNGNLLDYKLPTSMDIPDLHVKFVETNDPTGPYGNKALGEPPAIPVAAAIRNALLNAAGVAVNHLPLNPQSLIKEFTQAGFFSKE